MLNTGLEALIKGCRYKSFHNIAGNKWNKTDEDKL